MSADLRGFEYVAEPVLRRRRWQLDAVAAEMSRTLECLTLAKTRAATLRDQLVARAEASSGTVGSASIRPRTRAR